MKTIKRVISLTMAVIMLFTGTPALQASDLAFDRAQLAELQKEILPNLEQNLTQVKDPIQELIDRYQEAKKNAEEMAKELNKIQLTEEQQKESEEYISQLKEKAEELAKTEEYVLYVPEPERKAAAFNTLLYLNFLDCFMPYENEAKAFFTGFSMFTLGMLVGWIAEFIDIPIWLMDAGAYTAQAGIVVMLGTAIIALFSGAYIPVINWDLSAEETAKVFSEKPFALLAKFGNGAEYANLNNKCPQLLKDAVDIEYYTSLNPSAQNIKEKLYIGSLGWYKDSVKDRTAYLHKFAERLRAEAKAGAKQQFNNSRIGLGEK